MIEPYYKSEKATIYVADCLDVLPGLAGVDAVVTDPPYPKEFEHVWEALGEPCFSCCNDGAFLVTLCGQYQVPLVLSSALAGGWKWFWIGIVPNTNSPILHGYSVKVCQKPVLMFRKPGATPQRIWRDNFTIAADVAGRNMTSPQAAKALHEWGQVEGWFYEPSTAFAPDDGVILDPFMGSGTVGVDAIKANRRFIGIEINHKHAAIARRRLIEAEQAFALFEQPKVPVQMELIEI